MAPFFIFLTRSTKMPVSLAGSTTTELNPSIKLSCSVKLTPQKTALRSEFKGANTHLN
jgi:hypothetical protein